MKIQKQVIENSLLLESVSEVEAYLLHRNFCVRKRAMEYKYQLLKTAWPGLEKNFWIKIMVSASWQGP